MSWCVSGFSGEMLTHVRPWNAYHTIMWVGDSAREHPEKLPLFLQRLREMGINTAMVYGSADPQPLLDNHFAYYVENLVNRGLCLKFNSSVRDWDKFVTDWAQNSRPESALMRDYCLDDPHWLAGATAAVEEIVRKNKEHQPLAYNLRDELSTTISANPFDYDFNPIALEHFREWLKTQYVDLGALNAEWETQFDSWSAVKPFTTDQIKNRMASGDAIPHGRPDWQQLQQIQFKVESAKANPTRWNFAPWADFRTYMDLSLARALGALRQKAHELDPGTPVGIEGTQMPDAFGGYDLWRLSQVLDWVEPYDIGSAREIFGSFMPDKPILTTVFESSTNPAQRRLWHLLLEGDRGCLVWWSEDCIDWKTPDLKLTAKALQLGPVLKQMTSPLAGLFVRAQREYDPVYIVYSQPSIQVDWLLESTVDGSTWLRRFSSFEAEHNQLARTRTAWLKGLEDLGYSPQFIPSSHLGEVRAASAVLVLPNVWALSAGELASLDDLLAAKSHGGVSPIVLAEGPAGAFDQHGKLRVQQPVGPASRFILTNSGCIELGSTGTISASECNSRSYLLERLSPAQRSLWLQWVQKALQGMPPPISVAPDLRVRTHRFRLKSATLVAFERNIEYQMSENLKQSGGNQMLEMPVEVEVVLPQPSFIYDLRSEKYLGHTDHLRFTLDPWQPSLFVLLAEKLASGSVVAELERRSQTVRRLKR